MRVGAVAAVAGALGQLIATVLEPDWSGEPGDAVRVVADSGFFTADRLIDLIGVLLMVGALTVVARTFPEGAGRDFGPASGQPFLVLMGALGSAAVVGGAVMKELADSWADASVGAKPSYLASFDAASNLADDLFFAAFLALGLYLAALAAAILTGGVYSRWIGWAAAVSAVLLLAGDLLLLASDVAFLALLTGFALFSRCARRSRRIAVATGGGFGLKAVVFSYGHWRWANTSPTHHVVAVDPTCRVSDGTACRPAAVFLRREP